MGGGGNFVWGKFKWNILIQETDNDYAGLMTYVQSCELTLRKWTAYCVHIET